MKTGTDIDGSIIYLPESPLKEAVNIREALKPLGFEVLGFRRKYSTHEFVLHLNFVGTFDNKKDSAVQLNGL